MSISNTAFSLPIFENQNFMMPMLNGTNLSSESKTRIKQNESIILTKKQIN